MLMVRDFLLLRPEGEDSAMSLDSAAPLT